MQWKLKSRTKCPPGGFMYEQRQTGWRSWIIDPTSQWDFNLLCQRLREHRLANQQKLPFTTDMKLIEDEVDSVNARRVAAIPLAAQEYLIEVGGPPPNPNLALGSMSEKLQRAVQGLKALNAGRLILLDWEKSGDSPVAKDISERRASRCIECGKNGKGDFTKWFTVPASELLKRQIERLNNINLATAFDSDLGICEICLCPLKVKVWTPMVHISKYLSTEIKTELAAITTKSGKPCWVTEELS